jgi:hemerythrin-like domain-containing protein
MVAAGAAGLGAAGAIAARTRARRQPPMDPIANYVTRFRLSHEALRRNLARFVDLIDRDEPFDAGAFGDFVRLYDRFLSVHHESEDRVVFPTLRHHGRLKSTDAAHLDRWGAEHHDVNAAGQALAHAGARVRDGGRAGLADVRRCAEDLAQLLTPHLASEEELFTRDRLAEIIPARAIAEIDREAGKLFRNERGMPLFYAHSLRLDEQKQAFASAPWIFRKVILPVMDRRSFSQFRPFVVSTALQA